MGQVSPFLRSVEGGLSHWCPGCGEMHMIPIGAPYHFHWSFDGNVDAPTFGPSVRITGVKWDAATGEWPRDAEGKAIPRVCHYFIRSGQIEFCGDSTHALAGQTVPLPPLPEGLRDE